MVTIKRLLQETIAKSFVKIKSVTDALATRMTSAETKITAIEPLSKTKDASVKLPSNIVQTFVPRGGNAASSWGIYYKIGSRVTLIFVLNGGAPENYSIVTLPVGYRPYTAISQVGYTLVDIGTGATTPGMVTIFSDGEVDAYTSNGYLNVEVSFDAFN